MTLGTSETGIALLCNARGVIQLVIRDDLGITGRAGPGRPVTALVDSASVEKMHRFLDALREEKAAFNWELNVDVEGRIAALYFTGSAIDKQFLIVGAISRSETAQLFEGMMRINNQQANALRAAIKDQTTLSRDPTVEHSDFYEQLTRLNNELVTAQRELAKKNGELERLYAAEKQRTRELNALYQATTALLSTLDLDTLLDEILDAALEATPNAERAGVMLIDRATDRLRAEAVKGCSDPRDQSLMLGALQNHVAEAIRERKPSLVSDLDTDLGSHEDEHREPGHIRSAMIAPLILDEEVFGVLELFSARRNTFTADNLRLLETFAATATVAIRHAQLHAEVRRLAITDPLTGLYNRRGFSALGEQEMKHAQRFGGPLTALMIDLDHFKEINDTYGHAVGDQVLAQMAGRCHDTLRTVDLLGRLGGEEFAVLLVETDLDQAQQIAERLRQAISEEPFETDAGPLQVTVSIGIASLGGDETLDALLARADEALYAAKKAGRNRVSIWETDPQTDSK